MHYFGIIAIKVKKKKKRRVSSPAYCVLTVKTGSDTILQGNLRNDQWSVQDSLQSQCRTLHQCQRCYIVSGARLSRRWSSAHTPCPGSLQTPPCAYAPYGSSVDANFPPSAYTLYLHTEAGSPLDSHHLTSACQSRDV